MEKKMPSTVARTVDEYIDFFPEDVKQALARVRKAIRQAAPEAQEVISYQVPCFKQSGPLVFFAAFPNHCSLFVVNKEIIKAFQAELKPFHTSGTSIHFTIENQLPVLLIKKIVKARLKENEEAMLAKKKPSR